MGPVLVVFKRTGGLLIGDARFFLQQFPDLVLRHFDDRRLKFFLRDPVQQEFFFPVFQFSLFKTRTGIKYLIQVNILRGFIGGKKKSIAALLVQKLLQGFQFLGSKSFRSRCFARIRICRRV